MKFDPSKALYFPTQKWKEGEYKGAATLQEHQKDLMAPIYLMPPPGSFDHEDGKVLTPDEHIKSFGARIAANWTQRLCFIDAGQIDRPEYAAAAGGEHPLKALFERSLIYNPRSFVAPATALDRTLAYQAAAAKILALHPELPVCIRVTPLDFEGPDARKRIDSLLGTLNVRPDRSVLVLDAAELELSDPAIFSELLANMINALPYLHQWKQLVVALCALPLDLKAPPRQTTRFKRTDWDVYSRLWKKHAAGELLRLPAYSDYGTENASFAPAGKVRPATQLRYTSETEIAIHKGENTKTGGYKGIFPVAVKVVEDVAFKGGNFSAGDLAIENLARRPRGTGNASSWKQYGVSHHQTLILSQLMAMAGKVPAKAAQLDETEQFELIARDD